jgi:hypothetical protein
MGLAQGLQVYWSELRTRAFFSRRRMARLG